MNFRIEILFIGTNIFFFQNLTPMEPPDFSKAIGTNGRTPYPLALAIRR